MVCYYPLYLSVGFLNRSHRVYPDTGTIQSPEINSLSRKVVMVCMCQCCRSRICAPCTCCSIELEQLERLRSEDTPAASLLPILLSHIVSQVKRRQSQSYKFKEFTKISNCWILKQTLHATHFLKLLDKICKYERDPMSIVEDTERTRFCPQTDRRIDGQVKTSLRRGV